MFRQINWLGFIVALIAAEIFSFAWFMPQVFGDLYTSYLLQVIPSYESTMNNSAMLIAQLGEVIFDTLFISALAAVALWTHKPGKIFIILITLFIIAFTSATFLNYYSSATFLNYYSKGLSINAWYIINSYLIIRALLSSTIIWFVRRS